MEALKKKYDRVILVVVSIIAIAVSVLLALKSFGFSERYDRKTPKKGEELGETGLDITIQAMEHYGSKIEWKQPTMPGVDDKILPLFKSVPVVLKPGPDGVAGDLIDLRDPNAPQLRPPMDNAYLVDYNLEFRRSDVAKLDPDNDGFTNEQEFVWGRTNPKDVKDFPAFTRKLYLKEMIAEPYILKFNGASGEPPTQTFSIRRDEPVRKSFFDAKIGEPLNDDKGDGKRFTPTKYEKKEGVSEKSGLTQNESELELTDADNDNEVITLIYRQETNVATKFAVFAFSHPGHENWTQKVKVRDSFTLPNDPKNSYKLESVDENGAKISILENGTPKIIEIGTEISPK